MCQVKIIFYAEYCAVGIHKLQQNIISCHLAYLKISMLAISIESLRDGRLRRFYNQRNKILFPFAAPKFLAPVVISGRCYAFI